MSWWSPLAGQTRDAALLLLAASALGAPHLFVTGQPVESIGIPRGPT